MQLDCIPGYIHIVVSEIRRREVMLACPYEKSVNDSDLSFVHHATFLTSSIRPLDFLFAVVRSVSRGSRDARRFLVAERLGLSLTPESMIRKQETRDVKLQTSPLEGQTRCYYRRTTTF